MASYADRVTSELFTFYERSEGGQQSSHALLRKFLTESNFVADMRAYRALESDTAVL